MSGCTNCDAVQRMYSEAQTTNNALQSSLARAEKTISTLQGQLTRLRSDDDAPPAEVRQAMEAFRRLCGYPGAGLDGKRSKALGWAISKKGLPYVLDLIRGAGRFAYTYDFDWQEAPHPSVRKGQIKRNKFESIFDHTVAPLEKFHDLAMRGDRLDGCSNPGETPWVVGMVPSAKAMKVVSPWDDGPLDGIPEWLVQCPGCGVGWACRVRWGRGGAVDVKCARGCAPAMVLAAFELLRDGKPLDQMDLGTEMAA